MRLTPSDFYTQYRPTLCDLRVYLRHHKEPEAEPGPYELVIRELGRRHEIAHLKSLEGVTDLSGGTVEEREARTRHEVDRNARIIYQPVLTAEVELDGIKCEVTGEPDFLILDGDRYKIRDVKISRRITEDDHLEIIRQLQTYGWLLESAFGAAPSKLEVFSGSGELVEISVADEAEALESLRHLVGVKQLRDAPYSPVGWTKCAGCGFRAKCWTTAEETKDSALVLGVDQGLAIGLRQRGITTTQQLVESFDTDRLAAFQRPWGAKLQRVGKKAEAILRSANSLLTGKEVVLQTPEVPASPDYVMFDLEGLPPHLDEIEKIYLWGLQVFGAHPSEFQPVTANFGPEGDKAGWEAFLATAALIFQELGDVPFVHWHHYERVRIDMYLARYGDEHGIAARVKKNLLDLLPIAQKSIVLPLPSYSLKVVEKYIGFKRTQDEYGGDWAMAKYIEATETEDKALRDQVMDQILTYNKEDLAATWAVLQWLRSKRV